jgi:hypothetical protein
MLVAFVAALVVTALFEGWLGRSPLGPDGRFGWWDGNIWSSENSQRVADVYSFSHIVDGILFFALMVIVGRGMPMATRFVLALSLATGWELFENSSFIIHHYRAETIPLGYFGDSILNSCSDIAMMALGFWFASRMRVWVCVAAVMGMELFCMLCFHDSLCWTIIRLVHPAGAIQAWRSAGHLMH